MIFNEIYSIAFYILVYSKISEVPNGAVYFSTSVFVFPVAESLSVGQLF